MKKEETLTIKPPKFKVAEFLLRGTAPYVSNKFSGEAREKMRQDQLLGSQKKKGAKREPKDFEARYQESMHHLEGGGYGIPAGCFRQAIVSACRIVGFKMTLAKLAVFILHDGFDLDPGERTPLVKITKGEPRQFESCVRLATGVADIASRGLWEAGWEVNLRVRYDADMFTEADIRNLLDRVGIQVGIGSGRPDSKTSCGMGWGTFEVVDKAG